MNIKNCFYSDNKFGMNYFVAFPKEYEELPLIVYLHGAGERGKNIEHLYRHGIPKLLKEGKEYPAIILCPQCPEMYVWDNVVADLKGIIDSVVNECGVKNDRIAITGSSMGGFGTWMMGKTYPTFFSGIAPVAGGGMSWRTSKLVSTPVFAVHGTVDGAVPIVYSQLMVDGVNGYGGKATLLKLDDMGHNDGIDYAYRNTELIDWLIKQRRTNFDYIKEFCEDLF